jgi:hypothetical protein
MEQKKLMFTTYTSEKFERIEVKDLDELVLQQDNSVK